MQLSYFAEWTKRTIFYVSKMITEQLKSGETYDKIRKCIHVSILHFNRFSDKSYYRTIHLADDNSKEIYTDLLEMQILELSKLPADAYTSDNTVESWMSFLRCESREDLAKMAEQNLNLKDAFDHLDKISADEEKRRLYEIRERALHDYNTQMESNYNKGLTAGFEKGETSGLKLASKIFNLYYFEKNSPVEISEKLGVELEKVNQIIQNEF